MLSSDLIPARPSPNSRKRDDEEVYREHSGDYKRWIEHSWHKEKRAMEHEELRTRWFSGAVSEWFNV